MRGLQESLETVNIRMASWWDEHPTLFSNLPSQRTMHSLSELLMKGLLLTRKSKINPGTYASNRAWLTSLTATRERTPAATDLPLLSSPEWAAVTQFQSRLSSRRHRLCCVRCGSMDWRLKSYWEAFHRLDTG